MAIVFQRIPGFKAALDRARAEENSTREDNFLALNAVICGLPVRIMTLRDYVALLRNQSPFLHRIEPNHYDLVHFLWVLSPQIEKWHNHEGWRRPLLKPLYHVERALHRRRVRRAIGARALERVVKKHHALYGETDASLQLKPDHPLAVALKECFDYIERIFFDLPVSNDKAPAIGLHYLNVWFHSMQSEYHLPTEEVWEMPMPRLLSRLKAIQRAKAPVPDFNAMQDALISKVIRALRSGMTEADIMAGKLSFDEKLENN